jgi:hypothetical protein
LPDAHAAGPEDREKLYAGRGFQEPTLNMKRIYCNGLTHLNSHIKSSIMTENISRWSEDSSVKKQLVWSVPEEGVELQLTV